MLHLVILIHLLLIHFQIFSVKPSDFKDIFADVEDLSYSNMFLPPKIRIKIHINCRTYGPGTYWYQNRPRNIEEDGRMMHRIISYHIFNVSAHPVTKWPVIQHQNDLFPKVVAIWPKMTVFLTVRKLFSIMNQKLRKSTLFAFYPGFGFRPWTPDGEI